MKWSRGGGVLAGAALTAAAVAAWIGCGNGGGGSAPAEPGTDAASTPPADDAGDTPDGASAPMVDSGHPPPPSGDGGAPADAGKPDARPPGTWDGGALSCASPGNYLKNGGACGTERWPVKTGTDNGAAQVALVPQITTWSSLVAPPLPSGTLPYASRVAPMETTLWALRDMHLIFVRLESTDSDYHLVLSPDGSTTSTIITEIPYPPCVNGGAWSCEISRARAALDAQFPTLQPDHGKVVDVIASVVGTGFWDPEHGQYGVSPNDLELHPVLGICFGQGCDPTKD